MSQLLTVISLKWMLLRHSFRSKKGVVNNVANLLGMLTALAVALAVATGLGFVAYMLSKPGAMAEIFRQSARRDPQFAAGASLEFIFFSIFAFLYLMWATLPLSIGSAKQFDAGKLLIYPISLHKLFAIDLASEVTTLQSVFAIPTIIAICLGAGLATGTLVPTLLAAIPITLLGICLTKWLGTSIGSLVQRKRARGESIIAVVGAVAGLAGALAGQIMPLVFKHAESFKSLRWTPPGAAAALITTASANETGEYLIYFLILTIYIVVLLIATYWIARRAALGLGEGRRKRQVVVSAEGTQGYAGWELPLVSSELSALVEKELRYIVRNAQLRMMALMPLILIVVRFVNSKRFDSDGRPTATGVHDFLSYASSLFAAAGVLYVFLLLAGLACNQFAFEEGGMRTLILSPVNRKKILLGKNIALTVIAFVFSIVLLLINELVFRDLTVVALLFVFLSFICYAALMSTFGNWLSIQFPKRMQFGKRLNVSGISGLLFLPLLLVLGGVPMLSVVAGYVTKNTSVQFLTLAGFAILSCVFYWLMLGIQGRRLSRREIDILDAVREPTE